MKFLVSFFAVLFLLFVLFGDIRINGIKCFGLKRMAGSCIGAALFAFVFGLPILGLLTLLGL